MITHFHIENFKSLADFDLPPKGRELAGFTCLIGMNGSGKTTLLQAFDFTAQLMGGRVNEWLSWREWAAADLLTKLDGGKESTEIYLSIDLKLENGESARWDASFEIEQMRCLAETVRVNQLEILTLKDGKLTVVGDSKSGLREYESVPFEYEGSILSTLRLEGVHPALQEVKSVLLRLHSLELLSPQLIRRSSRESADIGPGGERLAGFLSRLTPEEQHDLLKRLKSFYPQVENWWIQHKVYGWKGLMVDERAMRGHPITEAHINDGFLRVVAMLSQTYTHHRVILLDEIENGINPAIAEELVDFLVSLTRTHGKQIIVTTHSPVILNYLDDSVAREGVILLFKTPDGRTHCRRYFDVPENERKLRVLGPGEVFLDTSIEELVGRLAAEEPRPDLAA